MTKKSIISPDLSSEFSSQPQQRRDVLIACAENIEQVKNIIEKSGIRIGNQMAELRILQANIDYNDLIKLQEIGGIDWIEIDEEAQVI